jgi:hypothetical protein
MYGMTRRAPALSRAAILSASLLSPLIMGCAESETAPARKLAPEAGPAATQTGGVAPTMNGASSRRTIGLLTAYYSTSPAQGRPPDGELPPGTSVDLEEQAGSYARVRWNGKSVWVATDSLNAEPARPREIHKIPTH